MDVKFTLDAKITISAADLDFVSERYTVKGFAEFHIPGDEKSIVKCPFELPVKNLANAISVISDLVSKEEMWKNLKAEQVEPDDEEDQVSSGSPFSGSALYKSKKIS